MIDTYFSIVDCNNFYASCERAFNPKLRNQPIVVLSNNDGCVVARSNEAKALNIEMGIPYWQVQSILQKHKVHVFSSNYQLYGDMSARVMNILQAHCADVEIYSIDEAFLKLFPLRGNLDKMLADSTALRTLILRATGIPVSIGIAKTKTLAKLANHIAKKRTKSGVFILDAQHPILSEIAISKVWGIARGYERRLAKIQVKTVADLSQVEEGWMRQEFGVVGVRLLKELQGFPCYDLDPPVSQRKNMMVSRSFRKDVFELEQLMEAIATYATRLGEKLRKYQQATSQLTIFLQANRFKNIRKDGKCYFALTIELPLATACTNELIAFSRRVVKALFEKGTNYKKVGILAGRLRPQHIVQGNLFVTKPNQKKFNTLMATVDELNQKMGGAKVYFASCGKTATQTWARKEQWCSPRYTTRWGDILEVG